ncbi:MAG: CcmD family protein [Candidatus Marinimicrobia bacterium]|nr:CcmD family protein [Candidatus Neomarinimicrobiota bacterium]
MNAYIYLFMAYTIIWLGIFSFMLYMNKKTNRIEQEVTLLKELIDAKK